MTWTCRQHRIDLSSTRVMGIVNVTPDSFSDGGLYMRPGDAVAHARTLVRDGADIIDVGAESTRPGHRPLPAAAEWARLAPVLHQLMRELPDMPVSVDTYHTETAQRALDAGLVHDLRLEYQLHASHLRPGMKKPCLYQTT